MVVVVECAISTATRGGCDGGERKVGGVVDGVILLIDGEGTRVRFK